MFMYIKDVIFSILEDKNQIYLEDKSKLDAFNDKILGENY